jgi:hypothetical protein
MSPVQMIPNNESENEEDKENDYYEYQEKKQYEETKERLKDIKRPSLATDEPSIDAGQDTDERVVVGGISVQCNKQSLFPPSASLIDLPPPPNTIIVVVPQGQG